ncbi:hypothetical protein [uncultured Aquimarina sp.]|uniref:hypothetical protein n=1 Tax=uncultured Aquimarina sp. TaxID=575652 RepID=UPI00260E4BCA|nr:hypothetical protein [uncultured Aquimarina sp.]
MGKIPIYKIGDIVSLKSHPLFKGYLINSYSHQVPPLMLIQEVLVEDENKKKIYSDEMGTPHQIADLVKYKCVYFDDKKSEFNEVTLYESVLESYNKLRFHSESSSGSKETKDKLIEEVENYKPINNYEYGKVIQLKTKKLESRKKIETGKPEKYKHPSFTSPDFVLIGIKKEINTSSFYNDGTVKKQAPEVLFKISWFNHVQQKFSEYYFPKEFFIEPLEEKIIKPKKGTKKRNTDK